VFEKQRLSLSLGGSAYNELSALAKLRRSSMTEIVRLGLGLVKIAIQENDRGHKLIICTSEGQPLREILIP
jgi:hypothetical protein